MKTICKFSHTTKNMHVFHECDQNGNVLDRKDEGDRARTTIRSIAIERRVMDHPEQWITVTIAAAAAPTPNVEDL